MTDGRDDEQGFDEREGVVVSGDAGTVASVDPDAALDEVEETEEDDERGGGSG